MWLLAKASKEDGLIPASSIFQCGEYPYRIKHKYNYNRDSTLLCVYTLFTARLCAPVRHTSRKRKPCCVRVRVHTRNITQKLDVGWRFTWPYSRVMRAVRYSAHAIWPRFEYYTYRSLPIALAAPCKSGDPASISHMYTWAFQSAT